MVTYYNFLFFNLLFLFSLLIQFSSNIELNKDNNNDIIGDDKANDIELIKQANEIIKNDNLEKNKNDKKNSKDKNAKKKDSKKHTQKKKEDTKKKTKDVGNTNKILNNTKDINKQGNNITNENGNKTFGNLIESLVGNIDAIKKINDTKISNKTTDNSTIQNKVSDNKANIDENKNINNNNISNQENADKMIKNNYNNQSNTSKESINTQENVDKMIKDKVNNQSLSNKENNQNDINQEDITKENIDNIANNDNLIKEDLKANNQSNSDNMAKPEEIKNNNNIEINNTNDSIEKPDITVNIDNTKDKDEIIKQNNFNANNENNDNLNDNKAIHEDQQEDQQGFTEQQPPKKSFFSKETYQKLSQTFENFLIKFHKELSDLVPSPYDYFLIFLLGYIIFGFFIPKFSKKSPMKIKKRKEQTDQNVFIIDKKLKEINYLYQKLEGGDKNNSSKIKENITNLKKPNKNSPAEAKIKINFDEIKNIKEILSNISNDFNKRKEEKSTEKVLQNTICEYGMNILQILTENENK